MPASRPIDLTAMEVLFLTDRVQNEDKDEGKQIAKRLLIKLAAAYLEMLDEKPKAGTVTIWLTEPETWLARSKFNSGDRCDADPKLGIHMLRKLYTLLLAFDTTDAAPLLADAPEGDRAYSDCPRAKYVTSEDADLSDYDGLTGSAT